MPGDISDACGRLPPRAGEMNALLEWPATTSSASRLQRVIHANECKWYIILMSIKIDTACEVRPAQ